MVTISYIVARLHILRPSLLKLMTKKVSKIWLWIRMTICAQIEHYAQVEHYARGEHYTWIEHHAQVEHYARPEHMPKWIIDDFCENGICMQS